MKDDNYFNIQFVLIFITLVFIIIENLNRDSNIHVVILLLCYIMVLIQIMWMLDDSSFEHSFNYFFHEQMRHLNTFSSVAIATFERKPP